MINDMQEMKQARYEPGQPRGAAQCQTCHRQEFAQWQANSRHATATGAESFHRMKAAFTNSMLLSGMMGEDLCYACHGSKTANEGVSCETCHGVAPAEQTWAEVHQQKYKPGLLGLRKPEFCLQCHVVKNPMSGEYLLDMAREWEQSPARKAGQTCQDCHMRWGQTVPIMGLILLGETVPPTKKI